MAMESPDSLTLMTLVFVIITIVTPGFGMHDDLPARRLHKYLFAPGKYDARIRPSGNDVKSEGKLTVKLGMRLSQLLDVAEKTQIMTTSVWIKHEWYDTRLSWDPTNYGGVHMLHIPSRDLWRPDIVLYNNADGDFAITLLTKATVHFDGRIDWEPPAIYKSYCPIDVEFFPFDIQECFMKFGVWTYDGFQVDLQHFCKDNGVLTPDKHLIIQRGIDIKDLYPNAEWDILDATVTRKVKFYQCCPEPYPDLTFNVTIRRRTLFYTINLIIPCVAISCLTVLVFYLPADSCEKITLSVSILMALAVFFLLLNDIIPPTSLVIPLIGKYLLFTMLVVSVSIFLTVMTLSINFRSPSTVNAMSPWVRRMFTEILPKVLLMRRPELMQNRHRMKGKTKEKNDLRNIYNNKCSPGGWTPNRTMRGASSMEDIDSEERYAYLRQRQRVHYPKEVYDAVDGVGFISEHMKEEDNEQMECADWKYVAMVIDRFFLYIFTTAAIGGTLSIVLHAPTLYDTRVPMDPNDASGNCTY